MRGTSTAACKGKRTVWGWSSIFSTRMRKKSGRGESEWQFWTFRSLVPTPVLMFSVCKILPVTFDLKKKNIGPWVGLNKAQNIFQLLMFVLFLILLFLSYYLSFSFLVSYLPLNNLHYSICNYDNFSYQDSFPIMGDLGSTEISSYYQLTAKDWWISTNAKMYLII